MNYVQNHHLDCPIFVHSPFHYKLPQSRNAMNISNQNTMYCSTRSRNNNLLSKSNTTFSSIPSKGYNIRESSINEQLNILDMRLGCSLLNHKFNVLREMLPNSNKKKKTKPIFRNYNNTNVIERNELCIINEPIIRSRNESINLSQIADDIIDSLNIVQEPEKIEENEEVKKVNEIKIEKKFSEDNEEEKVQPKRRTLIVKSRRSQKRIERDLFNTIDNDVDQDNLSNKDEEEKKEDNEKDFILSKNIKETETEIKEDLDSKIENIITQKNNNISIQNNNEQGIIKEKDIDNKDSQKEQCHLSGLVSIENKNESNNESNKESQIPQIDNHRVLTTDEQDELILQEIIANTKRLEEEEKKNKETLLMQSIESNKNKEDVPFIDNGISTIKQSKEDNSIETKKNDNRYMTLLLSKSHSTPHLQSIQPSNKKESIKECSKRNSKSTGHSKNMIKKNIQMIKEITKRRSIWKLREAKKPHKVVKKDNCKKFINNPQQFFTEELCELVLKSYELPVNKESDDTIPQFKYRDNKTKDTFQSNDSQFKSILDKIEIKPIEEVDNEYSNSRTDSNVQTK